MNDATKWIEHLKLEHHPEGGWYHEVYRSDETIEVQALPGRYHSPHCFSTSIYFLLDTKDFSAFHRISSDETWHFYLGSPVIIYILFPEGNILTIDLGNCLAEGQVLQYTIPRNCWFAAQNQDDNEFSLLGCTVAPGFEFQDFELGRRQSLLELFPIH